MPDPQESEELISKALGHFRDPDLRVGLDEPADERAAIAALKAGLELQDWNSLRESGFNPYRAGAVVIKLDDGIKGE